MSPGMLRRDISRRFIIIIFFSRRNIVICHENDWLSKTRLLLLLSFFNLGRSSRGGRQKLILEIIIIITWSPRLNASSPRKCLSMRTREAPCKNSARTTANHFIFTWILTNRRIGLTSTTPAFSEHSLSERCFWSPLLIQKIHIKIHKKNSHLHMVFSRQINFVTDNN